MAKNGKIGDFAERQAGLLFRWILTCLLIAWLASWLIGTVIELVAGGDFISPVWFLEVFGL